MDKNQINKDFNYWQIIGERFNQHLILTLQNLLFLDSINSSQRLNIQTILISNTTPLRLNQKEKKETS